MGLTFRNSPVYLPAAFASGLGSIVSQTVLIRVLLEIYTGNELVIGLVLCNWMMLTAAGAWLGSLWKGVRHNPPILLLLGISAFMPLLSALAFNLLRHVIFDPGIMLGFGQIFFSSLLILLPFCLMNGALFPLLVARAGVTGEKALPAVYASESAGSIAGGLISGLVLVLFLDNFESLMAVILFDLVVISAVLIVEQKIIKAVGTVVLAVACIAAWYAREPGKSARQAMYPGQEIIAEKDSPFGNVVVTKQYEQHSFFLNGGLIFSTQNVTSNEESVHFALLQRPWAMRVLAIGGDAAGIQREMLKYPGCHTDFVEENSRITELQQVYAGFACSPAFNVFNTDARLFMRNQDKRWDVILVNTGNATSISSNRFYTVEYFMLARERLSPGGVLMTSLPSTADYLGEESRGMHSSLHRTLSSVFKNVRIFPGGSDYFLASDSALHFRVGEAADSLGINNLYVNAGYFDEYSVKNRSARIMRNLDPSSPVNEDFLPVTCFFSVQHWLGLAGKGYYLILIVAGLILLLPLAIGRTTGRVIWVAGFTGASMEVLLLLAYQSLYGHIYQLTSVVFAVFMAGLAAAALFSGRIRSRPQTFYLKNQFVIAAWCLMVPVVLIMLRISGSSGFVLHAVIFALIFSVALLSGIQFLLSARLSAGAAAMVSGRSYAFDLFGAAAGALFVSALLLPLMGVVNVALCIAGLNFITALYLLLFRRKL